MEESKRKSLADLREAAKSCRNCPLWEKATQTVFGEGSVNAEAMLVGEQPGEDLSLIRKALAKHPA